VYSLLCTLRIEADYIIITFPTICRYTSQTSVPINNSAVSRSLRTDRRRCRQYDSTSFSRLATEQTTGEKVQRGPAKLKPLLFLNNTTKHWPVLMIFSTEHQKKLDVNN